MIHEFAHALRPTRLRTVAVALLGILIAAACDNSNSTEPLATDDPTDSPAVVTEDSSVAVAGAANPAFATVSYTGIPYGPFGLWNTYTTVYWGPAPFTGSHNYVDAGGIITFINAARLKRQRLVLAMTGGGSHRYTTNGKFDLTKWKNKMNTFNTAAIRNAVAAGVADGTIIGNSMIDEPETPRWGGTITKATLDGMAVYAKKFFPTLPMGVVHGPPAYKWRTSERYSKVDYVQYQYAYYITNGDVAAWRNAVLAQSARDGVKTAFSLNILGGGKRDTDGTWSCTSAGQAGKGPYSPTCRMTSDQVRTWGRAIGPSGCLLAMWTYDGAFMSKSANQLAFKDVASTLASKPRPSCRRS
jgi:hypothetical protein